MSNQKAAINCMKKNNIILPLILLNLKSKQNTYNPYNNVKHDKALVRSAELDYEKCKSSSTGANKKDNF